MQLEAHEIRKSFGGRALFSGMSVRFTSGHLIGIVGPSGSGKSTLLGVLSGLIRPDDGQVLVANDDGSDRGKMHSRLAGWVPQGNNCLGARSVYDNALIGAMATGSTRGARVSVLRILAQMGLEEKRTTRASLLSGGELQRLAIARALSSRRPFIFADEPTGNLDDANTKHVIESLHAVIRRGVTAFVATHDMAVAERCDRVLDLRAG